MKIKSIQWNIGGGKIRKENDEMSVRENYINEGLDYIIDKLKFYDPDIITLQETHVSKDYIQAKIISNKTNLPYYINDVYAKSHIEAGQGLGQAIISRFPLDSHSFELFVNPKLKIIRPDGEEWLSHDKGITTCTAHINDDIDLRLQTLHLVPFHRFKIDPMSNELKNVRKDICDKILKKETPFILQGDFNNDRSQVKNFLPEINNIKEISIDKATEYSGKKVDHILYRGAKVISFKIDDSVLTDHFILYSEFEI